MRRIGTLNCGHSAFPIILGVNDPQYTAEELEQFRKENEEGITIGGKHYTLYEATQRQRKYERKIRKQRHKILVAEGLNDKEQLQTAQIKMVRLQEEYVRFSKDAKLPLQHARMEVAGFNWKHATAAEKLANRSAEEREQSPRQMKNGSYAVNWETVHSEEFRKKFDNLTTNPATNSAAHTRAIWALNNRDGVNTEEIYALDMRSGKEIARITDQNHPHGVKRTSQFDSALRQARKTGTKILLLHNHPSGNPPSIGDLNALFSTPDATGITVGHNGSLYMYTAPQKIVEQSDFDIAYRKNMKYTDITAFEKALEALSVVYGFTFEKL